MTPNKFNFYWLKSVGSGFFIGFFLAISSEWSVGYLAAATFVAFAFLFRWMGLREFDCARKEGG